MPRKARITLRRQTKWRICQCVSSGGLAGCLLALPINGVTTGTTNFATFSELAFNFRVTPELFLTGIVFSMLMGFVGGLFPAWRAAHENIVTSLRAV